MSTRRALLFQLAVLVGFGIYFLLKLQNLPDTVPVHFGIDGKPDRYSTKWELAIVLPMMLLAPIVTAALPRMAKLGNARERIGWVNNILCVVICIQMAIGIAVLKSADAGSFSFSRWILGLVCLLFAILGNGLGKTRPNPFIGIRVPWTYASEEVWIRAHRRAGKLWFVSGLVLAMLAITGVYVPVVVAPLIIVLLYPLLDSYLVYKQWRTEQQG